MILRVILFQLVVNATISFIANTESTDQTTGVLQTFQAARGKGTIPAFRTHMFGVISTLPVSRQCTILAAILYDSGKNPSNVMKEIMGKVPYQHLPCFPAMRSSSTPVNTSGLRTSTNYHVSRLFNTLPLAFQCKIMYDVTLTSRGNVTMSKLNAEVHQTMTELSDDLGLVDIVGKCTQLATHEVVTNTRVELGLRLRKAIPLDAWIVRFRKILPTIYLTYVSKIGRIEEFISGWKTSEEGGKVPDILPDQFLVKIQESPTIGGNVAMVSFSLYSRTQSGDYRVVDGDEVVASLDGMDRSVLDSYIQAEVIGWRTHGERDPGRFDHVRTRNPKLSREVSLRLQKSFPRYLLRFFKSLDGEGRCFVLMQISSQVGKELRIVEKRYRAMGVLPRRYFCSRATKDNKHPKIGRINPLTAIWQCLDKFIQVFKLRATGTTSKPAQNTAVILETRPFNSMEIVMFVLLGFLCLLVMAFVANCVVFTFKTKQLHSQYPSKFEAPQIVFGDGNCHKDNGTSSDYAPPVTFSVTDSYESNRYAFSGGLESTKNGRLLSVTSAATECSLAPSLTEYSYERESSI